MAFFAIFLFLGVKIYLSYFASIPAAWFPAKGDIAQEILDSKNSTDFPLTLPPGFELSVFAKNLDKPRVLAEDTEGHIFVSEMGSGEVTLFLGKDAKTIIKDLDRPHGILLKDNKLYVADETHLYEYKYEPKSISVSNRRLVANLPKGGRHFTRYLVDYDKDNILISIGSTCDTCVEKSPEFAAVSLVNIETGEVTPFSTGLRNAVYMTKKNDEVWVTEMGRDFLGDDIPPDEINILKNGGFYGWPYCYGDKVQDTSFDKSANATEICKSSLSSFVNLPAHSAPLGLSFIPSQSNWPKEYWGDLLVSFHGSWNRSTPTGYKVVRIHFNEDGTHEMNDFITGWLDEGRSLGRPAGILTTKEGALITDDKAGLIYELRYFGNN